ncbi:MAG: zinc-ribbon domain-containing protein [Proteobacteria bacterium]|nr:zinc-ribbon domain-containing protein [Pseudomonadota bacterium]
MGKGCPMCQGQIASVTNSLASLHPDLAAQWHSKNGSLSPEKVVAGSHKKAWWKCPEGPDHEWEASIGNRSRLGVGCPFCANLLVSLTNSLASLHPDLAAQWHPSKNGSLTPDKVVAGSNKKAWWKCPDGPDHEWETSVRNRTIGKGCPMCCGHIASVTNSLGSLHPDIAGQWHPSKNGTLTPDQVVAGGHKKAWWKCNEGADHEWEASIGSRSRGAGCPMCCGLSPSVTNSLASHYPDIAAEWHPSKNGSLTPEQVVAGSNKKAWWKCRNNEAHVWETTPASRIRGSGCHVCNRRGWTITAIRPFVEGLLPHLDFMTPAELHILLQQSGFLETEGRGRGFVKALSTGRFPREEIEKFASGQESMVDDFLNQEGVSLESDEDLFADEEEPIDTEIEANALADVPAETTDTLPTIQTTDALATLNSAYVASMTRYPRLAGRWGSTPVTTKQALTAS